MATCSMSRTSRRRDVLKGAAVVGLGGLAGCVGGDGADGGTGNQDGSDGGGGGDGGDGGDGGTTGGSGGSGPEAIRLGGSLALSGDNASNSVEFQASIEAMVQWWNDQGGIHVEEYGRQIPVEYVLYDDEGDKQRAVNLYNRLVSQDECHMLHLPYLSEISFSVVPVVERAGIPTINIGASGSDLVELFDRAVYSIVTPTNEVTRAMAEFAAARDPAPKIGALTPEHPTARLYADSIEAHATDMGLEYELVAVYSLDTTDLSSSLSKAQNSDVDFLINTGPPPTNVMFVNQAYDFGGWSLLGVAGGLSSPSLVEGVGADRTRGIVGPTPWHHKLPYDGVDEFSSRFATAYEEHTGSSGARPSKYSGPPAGGLQSMKLAIDEAGTLESEALLDVMANGEFSGTILGTFGYGDDHVIEPARSFAAQWHGETETDLGLEVIAPADQATAEPLYPLPQFQ